MIRKLMQASCLIRLYNLVFGWTEHPPTRIEGFSDSTIDAIFRDPELQPTPENVEALFDKARAGRGGDRKARITSACIYLHFAQAEHDNCRPVERKKGRQGEKYSDVRLSSGECFHRAANEMRDLGLRGKSAQCYYESAVAAFNAAQRIRRGGRNAFDAALQFDIPLALRSAGRAKAQYAALGVDDRADDAHCLQMEVRRTQCAMQHSWLAIILWIWRLVTGYGTSVRRWFVCVAISLVVFSLVYTGMLHVQLITLAGDTPFHDWGTPFYLAVMNMVTFGSFGEIVPRSGWGELAMLVQAITSFVFMGTGATFLSR